MEPRLTYIGPDTIVGVPARDLTDQDFAERELNEAELIASGLYKKPGNEPAPKKSKATKDGE
jgi:hypothetical protein